MNFSKTIMPIFVVATVVSLMNSSVSAQSANNQRIPLQQPGFVQQPGFGQPQQVQRQQQTPQYQNINMSEAQMAQPSTGASFYDTGGGIGVRSVYTNSPAQKAGINSGDFISKVNGRPIPNVATFNSMVTRMKAGETISLTKRSREGKETDCECQLMTFGEIMKASMVPEAGVYDNAVLKAEQMLKALGQQIKTAETELGDMKKRYADQEKQIGELRARAGVERQKAAEMKAAEEARRKQQMEMMRKKAEAEAARN